MRSIRKVVVLGGNGTMGAGAAAVFATAGIPTVLLARTIEKAQAGVTRVGQITKGQLPAGVLTSGTYEDDLERSVTEADLVFEAVSEDLETKRKMFALIDRARGKGTVVATVSSGLSIAAMCADRSEDFRKHFLGAHLFNPPTAIVGCEIVPHAATERDVVAGVRELLETSLGRVVVECADLPAFAGNRIGFKLLNEVAQLAEEHGIAYIDQLVGSHTGRALAPLATIDLVGWDVHKAIVDNLWDSTHDEGHAAFLLPEYMTRGIAKGHLGRKTRDKGGFFRVDGKGDTAVHFVLDPKTGDYRPLNEVRPSLPAFVEQMQAAIRTGKHTDALDVLVRAEGKDAELLRHVMLGYISYALGRVGEVVTHARDVDRIMGFGFHWAPPSVLVDAIGAKRTIELLERAKFAVPHVVLEAARHGKPLLDEPRIQASKYFVAA